MSVSPDSPAKRLILLELNEINFDVVRRYIQSTPARYPALKQLLSCRNIRTAAEDQYECLEPWIQWVSVHSGQSFAEHRIFRLGDIVGSNVPQMFERLEQQGVRVGCISPMNAENRLSNPAYFIPDPWTKTQTDGSWWSNTLGRAIAQVVNDNASSRISVASAGSLLLGLIRFAKPKHYSRYLSLAAHSKGASWRKALLLDLLLHDLHTHLFKSTGTQFSTLFLNAGAHIQHHYFLSASEVKSSSLIQNPSWYEPTQADPLAEMLDVYNDIIGEYLGMQGVDIIIATGLSQTPYDRIKYYHRLKDHAAFLILVGIPYAAVHPRMTRDFLIEFGTPQEAIVAEAQLRAITVPATKQPLFGDIDNRGCSLFVTLTFPDEVTSTTTFEVHGVQHLLEPHIAFVAIKNGMHQSDGFAFFTSGVAPYAPEDGTHVKALNASIMHYFRRSAMVSDQ